MKPNHIVTFLAFLVSLFLLFFLYDRTVVPARAELPGELFISEYIEGSSNNKALEIYNGTGSTVYLKAGNYDIQMFFNGNASPGLTIPLTGTVATGDVYVIANKLASAAVLAQADQKDSSGWYNGDDAVALRKNGVLIDVIGQIGFDPGTEWGTGLKSTADNTLLRRSVNCQGDPNGSDAFLPDQQWIGLDTDTFATLGEHTATCAALEIGNCSEKATLINEIQGSGTSSPMIGTETVIEGVVVGDFQDTAKGLGGFFLQEEDSEADADPSTSEGIFVYDDGFGVDVSVGQVVRVVGVVIEYYEMTEFSDTSAIKVCQDIDSPAAVTVNLPVTNLSDWERWEGMLVTFPQPLYATENYNLGRYGEVDLSVNGRLLNPTQIVSPGSLANAQQNLNDRSRIRLDDGSNAQNPGPLPPYLGPDNTLRLGDRVTGISGVLSYSYGIYEVHPTLPVTFTRLNERSAFPATPKGSLKIVSMNLLNYFTTLVSAGNICGPSQNLACRGADTPSEFTRQRAKVLSAFMSIEPDIAGVIEIENNPTDDALKDLVNGINGIFGTGAYDYISTDTIGTDAIKVAIIYKPEKVTPVGPFKLLDSTVDPNFIDTKNRPSLAQTFETMDGSRFTVVVNHLKSKGTNCNDIGDLDTSDGQGNCNLTRTRAANALIDWLSTDPTGSGDADFLLIGDFNSYAKEDPIETLKNGGYANLVEAAAGSQAYSYAFEGQSGTLDYALASSSFASQVYQVSELHVNADEPTALDYNDYNQPGLYAPNIYRYADHDPIMVIISPAQKLVYLPVISR